MQQPKVDIKIKDGLKVLATSPDLALTIGVLARVSKVHPTTLNARPWVKEELKILKRIRGGVKGGKTLRLTKDIEESSSERSQLLVETLRKELRPLLKGLKALVSSLEDIDKLLN